MVQGLISEQQLPVGRRARGAQRLDPA